MSNRIIAKSNTVRCIFFVLWYFELIYLIFPQMCLTLFSNISNFIYFFLTISEPVFIFFKFNFILF